VKHVREAGLVSEDMNLVVDILSDKMLEYLTNQYLYKKIYGENIERERVILFLKNNLNRIPKVGLKRFYKELNNKIIDIKLKLENTNEDYENILRTKKLRELRELFNNAELNENELKAILLLLKCMNIEYNKNIAFMIENEIYIKSRIDSRVEIDGKSKSTISKKNEKLTIDKLMREIYRLEKIIKQKDSTIMVLDQIAKQLDLSLNYRDSDIGYFKELTEVDFIDIIKDLGEHNSKIKEKFKKLIEEFDNNEPHTDDKLYELWMQWTDDEVTVIDRVLKKSMYDEIIKKSDIDELEDMSENIMHRHLLSRIVLHLIYRRMSSQCLEEVLV